MITIAIRFATILTTLRQAIAAFAVQQNRVQNLVWLGAVAYAPITPPNQPPPIASHIWVLLDNRLARMATRFTALFARWRAGTLPAPRPSRAGRPYTPRAIPRLPAPRGWLAGATDHHVRSRASQLQHLLDDPDFPTFLAEAPQAGRILRPLCHALALPEPAWLKRPPRPKPIRPPRAKPPEPEAGQPPPTPFRPLPPHIRAAARAWKKFDT